MSSPARPILSPSLLAKLAALATRPATNREIDDILTELAALPAHLVVRASREIATSARLGWWQPERRPRRVAPTRRAILLFRRIKERLWPKSPPVAFPYDRERLAANANLAWLFLFHPSGYLRVAALHRINTAPASPFFLAALAWRLNDWVRQVREAARLCAERELPLVDAHVAATAALYLLGRRIRGAAGRTSETPSIGYLRERMCWKLWLPSYELGQPDHWQLASAMRCDLPI
jgi:hypothetical protein